MMEITGYTLEHALREPVNYLMEQCLTRLGWTHSEVEWALPNSSR